MSGPIRTTTVTLNTSTGTQDITIPGAFGGNPKGCMVYFGGAGDGTSRSDGGVIGAGFTDGTNEYCVAISSQDGPTTSNSDRVHRNDAVLNILDPSDGSNEVVAVFSAWVTDGIRINITTASANTRTVTVVLFGGTDVKSVYAGSVGLGTGTSAIDVTDPGFEPTLLLTLANGRSSYSASSVASSVMTLGVAHNDGSDTQVAIAPYDVNGQTTTVAGGMMHSGAASSQVFWGAASWLGTIGDYDSSGFSITPSANAGSDVVSYLAIELSSSVIVSIDTLDSPTSTGDYSTSDPGFAPNFSLMLMSGNTSLDTHQYASGDCSIATFDSSSENCVSWSSEDGLTGGSNTTSRYTSQAVADLTVGKTDLHNGTFASFNSDGFTLNFPADVAGTARKWAVLTVGANPPSDDLVVADATYGLLDLM